MGFSRQKYWSGLPFPSPGDLSDPGIEPRSPALYADALTSEPPGKSTPWVCVCVCSVMSSSLQPPGLHVAYQASLSMEFSSQEYWSSCHFILQGIFPSRDGTRASWASRTGRQILQHRTTWQACPTSWSSLKSALSPPWGSPAETWTDWSNAGCSDMVILTQELPISLSRTLPKLPWALKSFYTILSLPISFHRWQTCITVCSPCLLMLPLCKYLGENES